VYIRVDKVNGVAREGALGHHRLGVIGLVERKTRR